MIEPNRDFGSQARHPVLESLSRNTAVTFNTHYDGSSFLIIGDGMFVWFEDGFHARTRRVFGEYFHPSGGAKTFLPTAVV